MKTLLDIIRVSRPFKSVGREKWGTEDALHAYKGTPPISVLFDFKTKFPSGIYTVISDTELSAATVTLVIAVQLSGTVFPVI